MPMLSTTISWVSAVVFVLAHVIARTWFGVSDGMLVLINVTLAALVAVPCFFESKEDDATLLVKVVVPIVIMCGFGCAAIVDAWFASIVGLIYLLVFTGIAWLAGVHTPNGRERSRST